MTSPDMALVRARALCAAGRLAWFELDLAKAKTLLEESLSLFHEGNDQIGALNALSSLIMVLAWQGKDDQAQSRLKEGMSIIRGVEDRLGFLPALSSFGWAAIFTCSELALDDAWSLNHEVATLAREADDKRSLAWALDSLGMCCYFRREYTQGHLYLKEAARWFRQLGEVWGVSHTGYGLGNIAIEQEHYDEALAFIDESLSLQNQMQNWVGLPYTLELYAYLSIALHESERAAKLLGATEKLRVNTPSARQPLIHALFERNMTRLRAQLSPAQLEAAWAQGYGFSSQEAIAFGMRTPFEKDDEAQ